ncbi:MAG TPA: tyrosine--tRNA ligase [Saprospiraceae bacterium]|nr:tyrosine--tRNA ligase [Lewinellaceae bacterium]HPK10604.1 tyrosine--tRNA ligase [Saprospiraceae bacterium]
MNFVEELKWRNMLHDMTPGAEEFLNSQKTIGYIGFDPTAPSLTIGNYVQIMLLNLFQKSGHRPIVLMGGATGRIGDPSGKDKERVLKSYEELDANLNRQLEQMKQLLDFEGPNAAVIVNNLDFYSNMGVLDFLRDVGKTLTISYMMSKDSVKNRLDTGMSFTEFSYQLLQAYDFQLLYNQYDCRIQMGGSDQWGNITSGTEFIRRNLEDAKAYAITTPLLTKADGTKFGKSEEGNIWMDAELTSPYKFYQFWLNADDRDINKFMRYFTFKSKEEVENLEADYADDPRMLKKILAEELTERIHGAESTQSVQEVSELLFGKSITAETIVNLKPKTFETIGEEIPRYEIDAHKLLDKTNIQELLFEVTDIFSSKSDFRRSVQNNAISINKTKVSDVDFEISKNDFIHGKYIMLENGKKNKYLLTL